MCHCYHGNLSHPNLPRPLMPSWTCHRLRKCSFIVSFTNSIAYWLPSHTSAYRGHVGTINITVNIFIIIYTSTICYRHTHICIWRFPTRLHSRNHIDHSTWRTIKLLGHPFKYKKNMTSNVEKKKLHGLSPRANYTDRATAACRRSDCQFLRIEGATWSAWRIPTAVFSLF
jgi:hypothetical protein